jgi:hypothetical protein
MAVIAETLSLRRSMVGSGLLTKPVYPHQTPKPNSTIGLKLEGKNITEIVGKQLEGK